LGVQIYKFFHSPNPTEEFIVPVIPEVRD